VPSRLRRSRTLRARKKVPEPVMTTRLHPTQLHLIAKVKKLRSEASELRTQVSAGSYGDAERERFYSVAPSVARLDGTGFQKNVLTEGVVDSVGHNGHSICATVLPGRAGECRPSVE